MATRDQKASQRRDFDPEVIASYKPLTLDELRRLPAAQWRIEGWLPEDVLAVLYGPPEAGKTFLALDWSLCTATGTPWLGCPVQLGKVLYVFTETPQGLTKRIDAWLAEHGEELRPRVDANFRVVPRPVNLRDARDRKHFVRGPTEFQPSLIVIDTLNKCFGNGDENSTQAMTEFVAGCNELRQWFPRATVLVIHHSGKAEERGARGSIVLLADAAAEFHLSQRGRSDKRKLENTKQRDAAKPDPLELQLAVVGESCVIRASGAVAAAKGKAKAKPEDKALAALAGLGASGATSKEWHQAMGGEEKCKTSTFHRYKKALQKAERVTLGEDRRFHIVQDAAPAPLNAEDLRAKPLQSGSPDPDCNKEGPPQPRPSLSKPELSAEQEEALAALVLFSAAPDEDRWTALAEVNAVRQVIRRTELVERDEQGRYHMTDAADKDHEVYWDRAKDLLFRRMQTGCTKREWIEEWCQDGCDRWTINEMIDELEKEGRVMFSKWDSSYWRVTGKKAA